MEIKKEIYIRNNPSDCHGAIPKFQARPTSCEAKENYESKSSHK
jgi:hypothetical protein